MAIATLCVMNGIIKLEKISANRGNLSNSAFGLLIRIALDASPDTDWFISERIDQSEPALGNVFCGWLKMIPYIT